MIPAFFISAAVALIASILAVTRANAIHALLYVIVSLLSVATIFFILGAPFAAALEVIIYAGAIMVLFVFVVMMINSTPEATSQERQWMNFRLWIGPSILSAILIAELLYIVSFTHISPSGNPAVGPKEVGVALLGPYVLGIELSSLLLMAGLLGAYHLGKRETKPGLKRNEND
jgi:NADH-quinone oxidoreductase subunit J